MSLVYASVRPGKGPTFLVIFGFPVERELYKLFL